MNEFDYFRPGSVEEACALLDRFEDDSRLLAGGTELIIKMKQRILAPKYLIDLKGINSLNRVEYTSDGVLKIGSLVEISHIAILPIAQQQFGLLSESAAKVGCPQIRNRATIGGNVCLDSRCLYFNQSYQWKQSLPLCLKAGGEVCHVAKGNNFCFAVSSADTVPALIALAARVKIRRSGGDRLIPIAEFYRADGDGKTVNVLGRKDIITEIQVNKLPSHSGYAYLKVSRRKAVDFPIACVAAVVTLDASTKQCQNARIAISGVSPVPRNLEMTKDLVSLSSTRRESDKEWTDAVQAAVGTVSNTWGLGWYRRKILPVMVHRALMKAGNMALMESGRGNEA